MKNHILNLITTCAPDNGFVQDAIEYALLHNGVNCPGEDFARDVRGIMLCYDEIIECYRPVQARMQKAEDLEDPQLLELEMAA